MVNSKKVLEVIAQNHGDKTALISKDTLQFELFKGNTEQTRGATHLLDAMHH